jgi:hypothetical protein
MKSESSITNLMTFHDFFPWGGVRLSPLGTLVTIFPIILAVDDGEWSSQWNDWAGETEILGESLPQCCFVYHKSPMT